jgi:hypothetical protein
MSRSGSFIFENEPVWLIHDSNSLFYFNRFVRTVSATRDTRFGIGQTVPATRDTRVRLVVLVYCQSRATLNDRLRPNAATTIDYRVGLGRAGVGIIGATAGAAHVHGRFRPERWNRDDDPAPVTGSWAIALGSTVLVMSNEIHLD